MASHKFYEALRFYLKKVMVKSQFEVVIKSMIKFRVFMIFVL